MGLDSGLLGLACLDPLGLTCSDPGGLLGLLERLFISCAGSSFWIGSVSGTDGDLERERDLERDRDLERERDLDREPDRERTGLWL